MQTKLVRMLQQNDIKFEVVNETGAGGCTHESGTQQRSRIRE